MPQWGRENTTTPHPLSLSLLISPIPYSAQICLDQGLVGWFFFFFGYGVISFWVAAILVVVLASMAAGNDGSTGM